MKPKKEKIEYVPGNGTARISPALTAVLPIALAFIKSVSVVLYLAAIPASVSTSFTT